MMADILKLTNTPIIDESIEEYEYHEYDPISGTNLSNGGDIRISIESQDVFTHPSENYLIFEGYLTKADGTAYASADEVTLMNNVIMHLFSRIEYHLSNQLTESLIYPGQATTMLSLLKYPDDFSKAQGLNQMWYKETATTAACEDYDKIVYGLKHSLTLVRKTDDDAIFRGAAAGAGKVIPDKVSWFMPHVIPADAEKFSIYKTIESKIKLPVAYRTRECDMLSVPESTSFT